LALLHDLNDNFALKDLGDLHLLLGILVKNTHNGVTLNSPKKCNDLLSRVGMVKMHVLLYPTI
jgi:histone deacetylase 1/2